MKDNISVFRIWAPDNALWTQWAKPVLFAAAIYYNPDIVDLAGYKGKIGPGWIEYAGDTAVIVDLPGADGVEAGLLLAHIGYRPVPLYNGVPGTGLNQPVIPVGDIRAALFKGAHELEQLSVKQNAAPAFLLDYNRMQGVSKQAGSFDNRWSIFPQDMPSAAFLVKSGIKNIVVKTNERINEDLCHILCRYQEQGILIHHCNRQGITKVVNIGKPSGFRSLWRRFLVIAGLTRNTAGGFGGNIPLPTESNGAYRMG